MTIQDYIDYINNNNIDKSLLMIINISQNITKKYPCGFYNNIHNKNLSVDYDGLRDQTYFNITFKD
jgi:hypothetical protein